MVKVLPIQYAPRETEFVPECKPLQSSSDYPKTMGEVFLQKDRKVLSETSIATAHSVTQG